MPGALPDGEAVPAEGPLPADRRARGPIGIYLHVPFCASRCGYCDFTTYAPGELSGSAADPLRYVAAARAELRAAAGRLGAPPVRTVVLGGGTPTLLAPGSLGALLGQVRASFPAEPDAEVTVEANPETVTPALLEALLAAGVTRISIGMQSAVPHVLATLERRHRPGGAAQAAVLARAAGFTGISLDLIYGTPGESEADWERSLHEALAAGPSSLSAYALVVEPGTRLARQVAAGRVAPVEDDVLADRYLAAERILSGAGLAWYEVSNWGAPCRHNVGYWTDVDYWGVGPGAHSHVDGVRWWNVRHPGTYGAALEAGGSPAAGREILDPAQRHAERIMLGVRLAAGLGAAELSAAERREAALLTAEGLLEPGPGERLVLTLRGRLLADAVVRRLLG